MTGSDRPGFLEVMKSVLAAFFGVQSDARRERDFQKGEPMHYVAMGLLLTLLFVLAVWGLVKLVLWLASG